MTEPSKAAMDGPELVDVFAGDDATPEYLLGWREGFRLGADLSADASATALQSAQAEIARLRETQPLTWPNQHPIGTKVRKKRGSQWRGTVVGYYSATHTPEGYAVESAFEPGNVQVYPGAALEEWVDG